jgi:hypothetical protein
MNNQPILDTIDPELVDRLVARKEEIERGSPARPGVIAALALGSVPIALAALSREAFGQGATLPTAIKNVLDFALALEIFENEFYKAVLGISASAAQNDAFGTVRTAAAAVPGVVSTLHQIQKHEAAHVATLQAVGATNDAFTLDATKFDFTGGRGSGSGPFAQAATDLSLLLELAQAVEDTGVRAYKGQAANLMTQPTILETALRIHSVEARHASRIRRMRRAAVSGTPNTVRYSGTIRGGGSAAAGVSATRSTAILAAFNAVYGAGANATAAPSELNVTHAGVDVSTLAAAAFGAEAAQEAFDEPLDRADVVAIVQPFFIPPIS